MAKKLENMSDEELLDAWTEQGKKVEEAKARNKELSVEFHRREAEKELARRLGVDPENLTESQKKAITALAEGIESEESVNNG